MALSCPDRRPLWLQNCFDNSMPVGEICIRDVVVCERSTTIREAAKLMRQHHTGDLVVVDGLPEARKPVGIVTDRDLAISVLALDMDPAVFAVGDLFAEE